MIIPDMQKLYEPFTKDGGTLDGAIRWIKKTTECDDSIVQAVIAETFIELVNGKDFTGPCPCGCDIKRVHTHIEHYMGKKCLEIKKEAEMSHAAVVQKNIQAMILAHIKTQNDEFIAENTKPPKPFFDWSRSETLKLWGKIKGA